MKKIAQGIVRFRKLILTVAFLLLIPSAKIGRAHV